MPNTAGEANIKIVPDASEFLKKLKADLEAKRYEYKVPVSADTTRAGTDLDRFRIEQEARPVKVRVEVDKSGLDQIKKGLSEAGTALGSALKFNLGAAGIGELGALATAVTTVAGSIQQLAGAGAVLPGVFAGIAADVGVTKLALMGVGDAFKAVDKAADGSAKNVKAANDALAKLAPQTADFVRQVSDLKPAFDSLQKGVSGNFFDGLGTSVKTLATTDLPLLQKGLGGIATSLNQNLKQLGTSLSSGSTQGLLDRILGNTGDAQARLSKSIDPIIHAFGTLAAVGTDSLPRLADGVGTLADRFDHFISAASDSGKLDKWINDGISGFDHLGNTLLNLGKVVTDLTGAAGGGGGLLTWLDQGSTKLHEFLSSAQGQNTLSNFFAQGREDLQQLLPILENLGPIAQSAFQAAHDATQIWAPIIKDVTGLLARNPQLVKDIADAFLAWKFVGVITGVSDAVKGIAAALGLVGPAAATAGTEGAAGLAPLLAAIGPLAALPGFLYVGNNILKDAPPSAENARARGAEGLARGPGSVPADPRQQAIQDSRGSVPYDPTKGLLPKAGGGPIIGPGAKGKDSVPIMAAPGEHMLTAGDVDKMGGQAGVYAFRRHLQGFSGGGAIPDYLAIANGQAPGGSAPGPTAPNPTQGGISNIASSFLSGLGGPLGQLSGFISGQIGGGTAGSGGGQGLTPGFAGLAQAGSDPNKLNQWGQQTGDWLGKFGAKTLMSFGTTLYQGALGLVGLQNSALSPNNPYFQDATKLVDGILGNGSGSSGESSAPDVSSLAAGSTSQSGVKIGSGATAGVKGAQRWRPTVEQALAQVGGKYGITNIPAWTNAILGQIQFESGGNPAALNPKDSDGLPAIGLGQFKAGTFAAHNITGGSINDPTAQIYAMIDYVSTRYGQNANGVPNGINQGHGYRSGGGVNGTGSGDTVPAMLTPGEHVLTTSDVKALGGQSGVYALREAIHMAAGGSVPSGVYVPPFPKIPDAQQLKPRPAPPPQQQRPSLPAAPVAPTAPSAPAAGTPDPTQPLQPSPFQGGFAPVAGSDGTVKSHTLPAISKGITSGFATAGAIAQQAVALGAAAATGGASLAGGGGMGGGGGGPSISGLFQQAGKIANDVADVASAFLVGNVTPGTTPNAYGETLRTAQNVPQTAPLNQSRNYVFNGIDGRNIVDSLNIRDAQDSQAALAGYRG